LIASTIKKAAAKKQQYQCHCLSSTLEMMCSDFFRKNMNHAAGFVAFRGIAFMG
jgi:hypothetical protein